MTADFCESTKYLYKYDYKFLIYKSYVCVSFLYEARTLKTYDNSVHNFECFALDAKIIIPDERNNV